MLPPLKPIAMKERISMIFIEYGQIDVLDGAFVVVDKSGVRTHIPVGSVACIMLEPGTRVSHRAAALAARVGTVGLSVIGTAGVLIKAKRLARIETIAPLLHTLQASGYHLAPDLVVRILQLAGEQK